jgi:hypothetical protein
MVVLNQLACRVDGEEVLNCVSWSNSLELDGVQCVCGVCVRACIDTSILLELCYQ